MKKAFYMMAAAAIALSSCSSEETTDVAKSSCYHLPSYSWLEQPWCRV